MKLRWEVLQSRYIPKAHTSTGVVDPATEDFFSRHATGFYIVFATLATTISVFCLYALWRGPVREFWICGFAARSKKKDRLSASGPQMAGTGPGGTSWTTAGALGQGQAAQPGAGHHGSGKGSGSGTVYLTDLKRQAMSATPTSNRSDESRSALIRDGDHNRNGLHSPNGHNSPNGHGNLSGVGAGPTAALHRPQPSASTSYSSMGGSDVGSGSGSGISLNVQARSISTPPNVWFAPDLPSPRGNDNGAHGGINRYRPNSRNSAHNVQHARSPQGTRTHSPQDTHRYSPQGFGSQNPYHQGSQSPYGWPNWQGPVPMPQPTLHKQNISSAPSSYITPSAHDQPPATFHLPPSLPTSTPQPHSTPSPHNTPSPPKSSSPHGTPSTHDTPSPDETPFSTPYSTPYSSARNSPELGAGPLPPVANKPPNPGSSTGPGTVGSGESPFQSPHGRMAYTGPTQSAWKFPVNPDMTGTYAPNQASVLPPHPQPQSDYPQLQPQSTPAQLTPPLITRPATAASIPLPAKSTYSPSPRGPVRSQSSGGGDYFSPAPWAATTTVKRGERGISMWTTESLAVMRDDAK